MRMAKRCLAVAAVLFLAGGPASGTTLTAFSGSVYDPNVNAMNAALGITGYTIEGFESTSLVPGLTVGYSNPDIAPAGSIPRLFDPGTEYGWSANAWDGTHALTNGAGNAFTYEFAQVTTFFIAGGTTSFGVGLANFQSVTTHSLIVNGVYFATIDSLSAFAYTVEGRNAYLRLDAAPGERIYSVGIDEQVRSKDGLVFDHVAFRTSVPEPGMAGALALSIGALASARRRRIR